MDIQIEHRPSYAMATVKLDPQETIQAESGAMVGMSSGVEIKTESKGGLLGGLKRKVLGGESFFINTFTAAEGGELMLAPALPGDVVRHQITNQTLLLQSGSYMASSQGIEVDTKWGGAKSFFGGEGLILLRASGSGDLVISSYGAIHEVEVGPGEKFRIDTGHIVAFDSEMTFEVTKVGSWKSTFFSGEGLVVDLTGPGKVMLQTRSPEGFLNWLIPQLPKPSSS